MRRLEWIALVLLALAVLVGCKSKGADTPADESAAEPEATAAGETGEMAEGTMGDTTSTALAEREEEVGREASRKAFLVQSTLKLGDEAQKAGRWEDARRHFATALDIDPTNAEAKRKLEDVESVLGVRRAEVATDLRAAEAGRDVRRQQAQAEISDIVRRAQMLEKQSDFDGAVRQYEKALLISGLYPFFADFSPNEEQLKDMIASATARKIEAQKAREEAKRREAFEMKKAEEAELRQAKEAQVTGLFRDANLAMEREQYDLARAYAEQILRLDPTNEPAARLSRIAREAKLVVGRQNAERDLREQWRRAFEELEVSAMPQVEEVIFPKEWTRVQALRKPSGIGRGVDADMDPKTREIENILATTMVNINFEETSLRDALQFLGQYAGINIVPLPSIFEEQTEEELVITLKADNVSVANALELITLTKNLSYRIRGGVVEIGTPAEGRGKMVLDLYDVKDLTVPIVSFPGEDINLVPSGGFGFGFGEEEEIEPIKAFEGDALADLIRDTIHTDVWDEGGDVQFREGGILIVKAPVETHRKIRELLDGLRSTGGLTVSIETRFITVEDTFLQDIGVDIRGLGDQSGGIGLPGKGGTETFDDVLYGTPAQPQGIGTSNLAGVYYNDFTDGDIRGRVENLLDVALGRPGFMTGLGGTTLQATFLDDTQVEVILRAVEKSVRSTLVVAPKLTVYNHERANVTVMNQVSYIQDFDVEIAQLAQIGDPIVQTLRDGVVLDVTPIVSADRKYVTLELRPTVANLKRPIDTFTTTLANGPPVTIQLPELEIQRVRTTVTMPDGGILMLGGLKRFQESRLESGVPWINKIPILSFFWSRKGTYIERRYLIILIKAKIVILEEMEPTVTPR